VFSEKIKENDEQDQKANLQSVPGTPFPKKGSFFIFFFFHMRKI
jgi:hypothetical protein